MDWHSRAMFLPDQEEPLNFSITQLLIQDKSLADNVFLNEEKCISSLCLKVWEWIDSNMADMVNMILTSIHRIKKLKHK